MADQIPESTPDRAKWLAQLGKRKQSLSSSLSLTAQKKQGTPSAVLLTIHGPALTLRSSDTSSRGRRQEASSLHVSVPAGRLLSSPPAGQL